MATRSWTAVLALSAALCVLPTSGASAQPADPGPQSFKAGLQELIAAYEKLSGQLSLDRLPNTFEGSKEAQAGMDKLGVALELLSRDAALIRTAEPEAWRELHERLSQVSADLDRLRSETKSVAAYTLARKFSSKPTWSVLVASSLRKVRRRDEPDGAATDSVNLKAARGEEESAQLVIVALSADIESVKIRLPKVLRGPLGATIPQSDIELAKVGYVRVDGSAEANYPDVLTALDEAAIKQGDFQPIWLTVRVPRDAKPGVYTGTINLTAKKQHRLALDLKLRVYDFELPSEPSLPTAFTLSREAIQHHYEVAQITDTAYGEWRDALTSQRLTVSRKDETRQPDWWDLSDPARADCLTVLADAAEHRLIAWRAWNEKAAGLWYSRTVDWPAGISPGGDVPGNLAALVYPGPDGLPLASLRLAMLRDGLEDYEYLAALRRLVDEGQSAEGLITKARQLLDVSSLVSPEKPDVDAIAGRREAIAEMIEQLRKE